MRYRTIDEILQKAYSLDTPRIAAVPAADDLHALEAVFRACKEGVVEPRLIGEEKKIAACLEQLHAEELRKFIISASDDKEAAQKAVEFAKDGKADLIMKGSLQTADYLRPVLKSSNGIKKRKTLSVTGFSEIPGYDRLITITDGALNISPSLEQKKEILQNAVESLRAVGYEDDIYVGILAAVENVNEDMPETVDAAMLKTMNQDGVIKDCIVEGPISIDLALQPEAADAKGYQSPVAGKADILIVPNMAMGNVIGKVMTLMGGRSIGYVAGAKVPIVLSSRASSAKAKYEMLLYCASCAKAE